MTLREAITVLLDAAAKHTAGVGCGVRTLPSETERDRIRAAAERAWRYVYGWEMTDTESRNLGLR